MMRGLAAMFALLLTLLLGVDAISLGLSRMLSHANPALAVRLRPFSGDAIGDLAERRLAAGDAAAAGGLVRAAIAREPMNALALRTLGMSEVVLRHPQPAARILRLAGSMSWRDGPTQAWLLERSIATGDVDDAVLRADSLLRRTEDTESSPVSAMMTAALQLIPAFAPPLAGRLALSPSWRSRFLIHLGQAPGAEASARAVLARLRAGRTPPTEVEVAPLIIHDVTSHNLVQARADWLALAPRGAGQANAALQDGQFRREGDGSPFTWTLSDGVGAALERVTSPGLAPGAWALSVDYDGYSTPDLASQLISLPPGPHTLSWREKVEDGDGRVLAWTISCAPGGPVLAQSPPEPSPPGDWRVRQLAFTVPAAGCDGQWLRLTPAPGERRGSNIVLYTDLAL